MSRFEIFSCKYYIFFIRNAIIFTQSCKFYIVTVQLTKAQKDAVRSLLLSHNVFVYIAQCKI